jgi:hypothetical protein
LISLEYWLYVNQFAPHHSFSFPANTSMTAYLRAILSYRSPDVAKLDVGGERCGGDSGIEADRESAANSTRGWERASNQR